MRSQLTGGVAERLLAPPLSPTRSRNICASPIRLKAPRWTLEVHKLEVVETGRTDTAHSTVLHVPSIGLIVGGDVVYNGIHPYLGETDTESRLEWIAALERAGCFESGRRWIAGHKAPENRDNPRIVAVDAAVSAQNFDRLDAVTSSARELSLTRCWRCIRRHANPGSLVGRVQTGPSSASEAADRQRHRLGITLVAARHFRRV